MDSRNIIKVFQTNNFVKVINKSDTFIKGSIIYAKEISNNIFLLFVLDHTHCQMINGFLANYDAFKSIGVKEPFYSVFFHSISKEDDIYFFEKYFN